MDHRITGSQDHRITGRVGGVQKKDRRRVDCSLKRVITINTGKIIEKIMVGWVVHYKIFVISLGGKIL